MPYRAAGGGANSLPGPAPLAMPAPAYTFAARLFLVFCMPALPRARQLRRDKTLFTLAVNTIRLHLEEEERLALQPQLREAPDVDLLFIQQSADQWVSLSTEYIRRKFKCSLGQALQLLGELQADLKHGIPVNELRQVPLSTVLPLPAELPAGQQEAPAEGKESESKEIAE